MKADDVEDTLIQAMLKSNLRPGEKPKLLSDNGSCYIANDFKAYLESQDIKHVRGRPNHPQTQGKIERYHRSMKNVIKLDVYYSPMELEAALNRFVHYYNYERYHESLKNNHAEQWEVEPIYRLCTTILDRLENLVWRLLH